MSILTLEQANNQTNGELTKTIRLDVHWFACLPAKMEIWHFHKSQMNRLFSKLAEFTGNYQLENDWTCFVEDRH